MSQEMGGSQWQFDMQMLRQLEAKCEDAELQVACDVWCAARADGHTFPEEVAGCEIPKETSPSCVFEAHLGLRR